MPYGESNGHVTDWLDWIEQGLTSPPTQYRLSRRQFYRSKRKRPNQQHIAMMSRDLERSRWWPNCVWGPISRKRLEIRTWSQWSTYRKWLLRNPLVITSMTSRDPKRSSSWSRYRKMQISRKRWEIEAQYQLTTNKKCHMRNRMDTWPMTSRDLEKSMSWTNYVWGPISRKRLEIRTWSQWSTYRKWLLRNP